MSNLVKPVHMESLLETIHNNDTVIVELGAEWCGPCKNFLPHFEQFAGERPDIACVKVDIESDPSFNDHYQIQSVPQVMLYKNGEYVRHLDSRTIYKLRAESL